MRILMDAVGIDPNKYLNQKIHLFRKLNAQELYEKLLLEGKKSKEAMAIVNTYLGHGVSRYDSFNSYVSRSRALEKVDLERKRTES
jgi:hypothetical protein